MHATPTSSRRLVENFIPTTNPFGLLRPPDWFLDELYAHDPMLRIFPSVFEPFYRVMRKTTTSQPWAQFLQHKPDTAIAIAHKLYPVMSLIPSTVLGFSWARVLLEVTSRDQHKFKDGNAVADHLEDYETLSEQRANAVQGDEADQRAGDFYRTLRTLSGGRVSRAFTRPEGAGFGKSTRSRATPPRRAHRPQGAGAGAFFSGRTASVIEARRKGRPLTPKPLIIPGK